MVDTSFLLSTGILLSTNEHAQLSVLGYVIGQGESVRAFDLFRSNKSATSDATCAAE